MLIQGLHVPVDVCRELQEYDWGTRCRWYPEKLMASCPFRDDDGPSFVVFFDHGNWADKGNAEPGFDKGNFITLLAYLRGEDRANTERYLIRKYLAIELDGLSLDLMLTLEPPAYPTIETAALAFNWPSEYLSGRGIDYATQERFRAGYHAYLQAVVLPWFDRDGKLVCLKYRSTLEKRFWFSHGGQLPAHHLFGVNLTLDASELFITEGEIDAMYLAANGHAAVALGTAHMSRQQETLIIQHPAKRIIIATDADVPGRKCADFISRRLGGYKDIGFLVHPEGCKDVNENRPLRVEIGRLPLNL